MKSHVSVLREARRILKAKPLQSTCGVCFAVSDAAEKLSIGATRRSTEALWRAADQIRLRIEKSLIVGPGHRFSWVSTWLYYEAGVPNHLLTSENLREYRLRWIDQLIKEYS